MVVEFNGLATGSDGIPKAIGVLPSDRLTFTNITTGFYSDKHSQAILFEGSEQEARAKWDAGARAGAAINEKDLGYPTFGLGQGFGDDESRWGINSNSTASTLIAAMELNEVDVPHDKLTSGEGQLILTKEELQKVIHPQPTPADSAPPTEPTLPLPEETSSEPASTSSALNLGGSQQTQLIPIPHYANYIYKDLNESIKVPPYGYCLYSISVLSSFFKCMYKYCQ